MKRLFKKVISTFLAVFTAVVATVTCAPVTVSAGTAITHSEEYANEKVTITLTTRKTTNKIYYTLDGSKPNEFSKQYKKPFTVKKKTLIRAVEYTKKGKTTASLKITVTPRTQAPTFSMRCATNSVAVAITGPTKDSTVYYTVDGTEPTTKSRRFETQFPVILESGIIIRAICQRPGYDVSETVQFDIDRDGYKVPEVMSSLEDEIVKSVIEKINETRRSVGNKEAYLDSVMCEAAAQRAAEISVCFSNCRPDGTSYTTLFSKQGISTATLTQSVSIVIDAGGAPADEFVESVMNSSSMRSVAMNGGTPKAGIGYYRKDGKTYWAMFFMQ